MFFFPKYAKVPRFLPGQVRVRVLPPIETRGLGEDSLEDLVQSTRCSAPSPPRLHPFIRGAMVATLRDMEEEGREGQGDGHGLQ